MRIGRVDDRLPLRPVEVRVDFPPAMPYTDFMERFRRAHVDELTAFSDLTAGLIASPHAGRRRPDGRRPRQHQASAHHGPDPLLSAGVARGNGSRQADGIRNDEVSAAGHVVAELCMEVPDGH